MSEYLTEMNREQLPTILRESLHNLTALRESLERVCLGPTTKKGRLDRNQVMDAALEAHCEQWKYLKPHYENLARVVSQLVEVDWDKRNFDVHLLKLRLTEFEYQLFTVDAMMKSIADSSSVAVAR